ncbi:MAG: hypothetical protein KAS12_00930 [Candidatus Aenigmarchaeota archaeon]|nr:hypothetical protein [Candidatus Aenigmarchaeota archaeon]
MSNADELKTKRDELNKKVKEIITTNKCSFDAISTWNSQIKELKISRDQKNSQIKELKIERDKLNKESNAIREKINEEKKDVEKLQKETGIDEKTFKDLSYQIKKLDWYLQTEQLSVKKDEELRIKLEKMESQVKNGAALSKVKSSMYDKIKILRTLRSKADTIHKQIVELSKESETDHKQLIETFEKIKAIREKLGTVTEDLKKAKNDANETHDNYIEIVSGEKKEIKIQKEQKRKEEQKQKELTEKDLKKKAETLFSEFLKGKKLNSDELVIMQKYAPRD